MIVSIDLALISWILMLNALGVWMKKTRLKDFCVPITVILGIVSIVLCSVWGCWVIDSENSIVKQFFCYGLPNGLVVWLMATQSYDIVHEFLKRAELWKDYFHSFAALFRKKEKEAKNGEA